MVEAKEEVAVKAKEVVKIVEAMRDVEHRMIFMHGRIVPAIEIIPVTMGVKEEAEAEAVVVAMDNTSSNHTTHSSINICRLLLLLLDKKIYLLLRWHW